MNNSILIQYFRRLSSKDLREMDKFVRSPFYNNKEEIVRLYQYIREALPYSEGSLEKKKVFAEVFPGRAFVEKQLRYTMSALLQLIKKYLSLSVAEQDAAQQQWNLCRALRQRRMERQFQQELEQAYKRLDKPALRNPQYHYQSYLLKLEELRYTNTILDHRRDGAELLEQVSHSLTSFYIAELLRQGCEILSLQSLKSHQHELEFLEEVFQYVANHQVLEVPAVSIHFHGYKALKDLAEDNNSEDHFSLLKEEIQKHWQIFSPSEIRDIYLLAVNYCIQRLNRGEKAYIREAFDLYLSGLENQVWLENGVLSGFTYKNVARLGIALGEEEWVAQFLDDYRNSLPKKERDHYWSYNMAYLYFQKNDYGNAMQLLREVDFKDVLNNLDTRRMLLRCYYELNEIYSLEYLLDSFQKYIQRQKGIGYHKNNYLNLIRFVRKKLQISDLDKEKLQDLAEEIRQTEQVAEKSWLLRQIISQ